ncbi:MAG TPA: hypothetical protein EYG31_03765 [Porticoccaceae bacterium]|jgi:hypothetical protein|nr:hypothetical protein [Gammaproteobacteria bacterium]HIL59735.1 hypothetical protein [Porticoccaceae bacterium]
MKDIGLVIGLLSLLTACEASYDANDGIDRIRTQQDVDAYNATVSAADDKLVCSRESVIGSNIRQFVCLTARQREQQRIEIQAGLRDVLNSPGGLGGVGQ